MNGDCADVHIEWIGDYNDCETCGSSGAEGAIVTFAEDGFVLDFTPHAHCYNSVSYEPFQIYEAILKHLGYEVSSTDRYTGD